MTECRTLLESAGFNVSFAFFFCKYDVENETEKKRRSFMTFRNFLGSTNETFFYLYVVNFASTFYEQLFGTKVLCAALLFLQSVYVILRRWNIGSKGTGKMLMKFRLGIDFTNFCVPSKNLLVHSVRLKFCHAMLPT